MASAPRQASAVPSNRDFPPPSREVEPPTVEESPHDLELLSILRDAAESGSKPLEAIVDAVADAARVMSGADGTALGLENGGRIVCRARSGNIAPPLGAPISSESGISGECLRTASILVCHDAMTDPRVDAEVCRMLGIRSIAAIPVRGPRGAAGILEAFAARPNAFDSDALRSLRELAGIAESAYLRLVIPRREAIQQEPVRQDVVRRDVIRQEVAPVLPRQEVAVKPMPAVLPPATTSPPLLAAEDILEGQSETGKRRLWIAGGVALILLLTVAVAWWSWQVPADEVSSGAHSVRAANAEPARSPQPAATTPKPGPGVPTNRSARSRPQIVLNAAEINPIEVTPDSAPTPSSSTAADAPVATTPRPQPEPPVITAPSVDLAPPVNSEELARLTSVPTQMPTSGPRISGGVVAPSLIHKVAPTYPMQARDERISGTVILSTTVATDGSVQDITVVKGSPILAEAAKTAVQQWRYSPATLNGTPVAIQKQITFLFTLP